MAVTSFKLNDELFIAFAYYKDLSISRYKAKVPLYVLQRNNSKFSLNQTLYSYHVRDVEHFKIGGEHFLVVANEFGYIQGLSHVYRWEAGKFNSQQTSLKTHITFPLMGENLYHLVTACTRHSVIQDIQIGHPSRCNTFAIHNITYIACGRVSILATVLRWLGKQFESFQKLPSSNVYGHPHIIQRYRLSCNRKLQKSWLQW